jgi:hypothetical protein
MMLVLILIRMELYKEKRNFNINKPSNLNINKRSNSNINKDN